MRKLILIALMATVLPTSGARAYDDCNGQIGDFTVTPPGGPAVYVPHITDGRIIPIADPATGPFYLDIRYVMGRQTSGSSTGVNIFSIWLYQETNSVPGLQRGGHSIFPDIPGSTAEQNPCVEGPSPDRAVF